MSERIYEQVSERYARAARRQDATLCCPTGYDTRDLQTFIPPEVIEKSYGCGTPAGLQDLAPGETVLDIGSGGGIDCFLAARQVGVTGRVIGVDMTDEMLALARTHAPRVVENLGWTTPNVEFRKGVAEALPVEDATVDCVISNCVINLSPDKPRVFREIQRVLRPGGRFVVSDIVTDREVPHYLRLNAEYWGACLSGALTVEEYLEAIRTAGLGNVHLRKSFPWQVVDGIHFLSLTLAGYQPGPALQGRGTALYRGPFRWVEIETGRRFDRGQVEGVDAAEAALLAGPAYRGQFLLGAGPEAGNGAEPPLQYSRGEGTVCLWEGDFAILAGCFRRAQDDDDHTYVLGRPLEICSKTRTLLAREPFPAALALFNRTTGGAAAECCPPEAPAETEETSGACC